MPKRHKLDRSIIDFDDLNDFPALQGLTETIRQFGSAPSVHLEELPESNLTKGDGALGSPPIGFTPIAPAPSMFPPLPITPIGHQPGRIKPRGVKPSRSTPTSESSIVIKPASANLSDTSVDLSDIEAELAGVAPVPRVRKIIQAKRVEDGHSTTQNNLYWYLWRIGKQVKESESRFVQVGYGRIQAELGLDRSNVQDAIQELTKKLSIQVVKPATVAAATIYEVFSCDEILTKRRQAGLIWVRRFGTRRADLLTSPDFEDQSHAPIGVTPLGTRVFGLPPTGGTPRIGATPTDPAGVSPTEGIGVAPIQQVNGAISKQSSTTMLRQFLQSHLPTFDDDAVDRLWRDCQYQISDVTPEEVTHLFREKLPIPRGVDNANGFLIRAVARSCTPAAISALRQGREVPLEDYRIEHAAEDLQGLLDDPSTPENIRQFIQQRTRKS